MRNREAAPHPADLPPRYFSLGLRLGLVTGHEVQAWVDNCIAEADSPSEDLLDLAVIKPTDRHGLYSVLGRMPDETPVYTVLRMLLAEIPPSRLEDIESCAEIARGLYQVWVEQDYSGPDEFSLIGTFDDGYDLARQGVYGTVDSWHKEFVEFVRSFSQR